MFSHVLAPLCGKQVAVFLVLTTTLSVWSGTAFAATRSQDIAALDGLRNAWGSSARSLNWVGDPCDNSWTGVVCDAQTNTTVNFLSLDNRQLQGSLPPDVGGLSELLILEMSLNSGLTGPLPKELGNLKKLQTLSIQWCNFTGNIPLELGNLLELRFLGLNGNNFMGSIPDVFGNFNQLTWLDISQNRFAGPMPISRTSTSSVGLDNLTSIQHFHFNNNSLSGSLPDEFFSLPNLIHLLLDHNQLSGQIPAAIGNSPNLTIMRLDSNGMTGPIPKEVAAVNTLTDLNLKDNAFDGVLPDLSNMTNLLLLDVGNNNFAQPEFPQWLLSMNSLQTLGMEKTGLSGQLPPDVFRLSQIEKLDFSDNLLNGSLVFSGVSPTTLTTVDLENNKIDGFVGEPLGSNGTAITDITLMLAGNPLCNNAYLTPGTSACSTALEQSQWSQPTDNCTNSCSSRKTVDPKTCFCAYPLELMLMLTSPAFSNFANQTRVTKLEVELAQRLRSVQVDIQESQIFVREINLTPDSRYKLDILFFPLAGDALPEQTQQDIIHAFRQHRFSIPEGPFNLPYDTFSDYSGNTTLSTKAVVGIAVGAFVAILFIFVAIFYAIREKRRADLAGSNPFASWGGGGSELGDAPKLKGARWFSLANLKLATNNWSEENELGVGGYGKVYKGVIKGGETVAIKRAQEGSMQGAEEFKNEIELLSRVHHRNLVGLVGFSYEGGEQCLVYEFMPNGTLQEHLKGRRGATLSWQQRLDITLGSARGLSYLHDHASPPIIHRDVKSANILLNDKMVAKVADFGLSKLAPDEGEKVVYSLQVKGTLGYLDPEYYTTNQLTDKSDVYSFGVVMLEVLCARNPIEHGKFIVREVTTALDKGGWEALRSILDPQLQETANPRQMEPFLDLALRCVDEVGANRPTTSEIVKELEALGAGGKEDAGVHKVDIIGKDGLKSPEPYSDTNPFIESSNPSSFSTEKPTTKDPAFQYSGGFGVTTTVQPK